MKKFKFFVIALVICLCCIVPFAGCGEDDSNPYYNGQNVIQSYEFKEVTENNKQKIELHVVYDSELVSEEDKFLALAVEKVFFERYNYKSVNAVLRSKEFIDFASEPYYYDYEYYFVMDYLRPKEAFHASTVVDDYISYAHISDIMYILIYP